jgi:hypothetical protein
MLFDFGSFNRCARKHAKAKKASATTKAGRHGRAWLCRARGSAAMPEKAQYQNRQCMPARTCGTGVQKKKSSAVHPRITFDGEDPKENSAFFSAVPFCLVMQCLFN